MKWLIKKIRLYFKERRIWALKMNEPWKITILK